MKQALSDALGVWKIVRKHRTVYIHQTTRIHLDVVDGLGTFLEFEAVLHDDMTDDEATEFVNGLMERFGIARDDLLAGSYSDMVAEEG